MSFFHGKSELTDTGHCFVSLPAEWDLSNRAHFGANQFNLTILRIIFLDDLKCDKYIYVSWNGARHRNRRRTDLVLFDRQFAGRQGITSGESILVQSVSSAGDLSKLAQCTQLDIRPLTEDDYQLVTVNSGEIERVLLDQLRVVTTAFCRGENSEPRFNVLPIWLRSSANVPIFVEVVDWEPKSAQGLVLVDSTKLGEEEENSSNTSSGGHQLLQSVFGMIRSSVAPIATAGVKLIQGSSFHRKIPPPPLLNRPLPFNRFRSLPPVCTAFISPHYFDHHHPDQQQYQIMSFKKVLTTAERQEKAKKGQTSPPPKAVDTSTMGAEERYYTVLAERLLRAHHDQEEGVGNTTEQTTFGCLLLVFPSQDVPPGSIALNEALRLQANIAATSYVHLSAVSDQRAIGQRVINSSPFKPSPLFFQCRLESWTAELQRRLKEEVVVEAKPLEDDKNDRLLKLGDGLFFVHHSELPSPPSLTDPDRLNWARLLSGCFLVDPAHTKVVVKQVVLPPPQPAADTLRELLKRCSRSIADLDSTHLRLLKLKNKRKPFGGYARQLERCTAFLGAALQLEGKEASNNCALLVTGGKGAGKSALLGRLLLTLADQPVPPFIRKLKCGHLRGKRIESLQKALLGELQEAVQRQPSKNPSFESSETPTSANENVPLESVHVERVALVALRLLQALHRLKKTGTVFSRVAVIATAKSADSLHRLLVRTTTTSVFDETVHLEPPDGRARRQIIECLLEDRDLSIPGAENGGGHQLKPTVQFSTGRLARATADYSPADISTLLEMALHQAVMACSDQDLQPQQQEQQQQISLPVTEEHISAALAAYTPPHLLASRGDQHQQQTTGRMLQDVGGLSSAKEALLETVLLPSRYPALFAALPLKAASSALLYGAPGTGKTVLVEAIANEAAAITSSSSSTSKRPLSFISVKGPELLSKYIGASEAAVRSLFLRAQAAAPCILFFDEFDSLAPRRGHDSTGVTDRLVNQLLTLMDGLEERKRDVFILAATSRPDLIDLALLRPGRFDRCVPVGLPGEAERAEILLALSRKLTIDRGTVDFGEVAARTEHFTGADLQALLYTAYLGACKRRTKAFENEKLAFEEEVIIRGEDVDGALAQTAPSLSASERAKFDAM
ncbi:Peroxisome biosynthesis protein pex1 [Tyrophagus putrescentiae]|nr:Peroxisome biosynthesis protein pex1 [Tyrophagus putrescentiae]